MTACILYLFFKVVMFICTGVNLFISTFYSANILQTVRYSLLWKQFHNFLRFHFIILYIYSTDPYKIVIKLINKKT